MSKKHCMFQCVLHRSTMFGFSNTADDIVENTGLITWDEAVSLWEKYKPAVVEQLEAKLSPEMVIWTGCEDRFAYRNDPYHVNHSTEVENGEFVQRIIEVIDPSKVTMGEPA